MKCAIILPLYKKGNKEILNNYRPIAILSSFAKIFEKLVKARLVAYLNKINFLSSKQFGFIAGGSTEWALLNFLTNIYNAINNHDKAIGLFIDITKAFDTVDHNSLVNKLNHIGIRGHILEWFKSYLSNRSQIVKICDVASSPGFINVGVPQGSVLGPVLFLIYINSIFDLNLSGNCTAFADDMALCYSGRNGEVLEYNLCHDLRVIFKWFSYHRMLLSDKTKTMYFSPSGKFGPRNNIIYHSHLTNNLCSDYCIRIDSVKNFKYLGLTLENNLSWKAHLECVEKSILIATHKFYKLRSLCPRWFLRSLYHSLVESVLLYGISSWGATYYSNIDRVYKAQKSIVKLIYFQHRLTPTLPFFREIKILPLRYLYVFKVLKLFFYRSGSYHQKNAFVYNTRNPILFMNFRCNLELYRRFYLYMAPFWFHKLPPEIRSLNAVRGKLFEKLVKKFLFGLDDIENLF